MDDAPRTTPQDDEDAPDGAPSPTVPKTTRMSAVVLGAPKAVAEGASAAPAEPPAAPPRERVLPGRLALRAILWPVYLLISGAGALSAWLVSHHVGWPVSVVLLGHAVILMWCWMYGVAWSYRRTLFKLQCFTMAALMLLGAALALWEWSQPQQIVDRGQLIYRDTLPLAWLAAGALGLALALLSAHLLYLGRGYRRKARGDDAPLPQPETAR